MQTKRIFFILCAMILFPDYKRCPVNLVSSIAKHMGAEVFHPTLPEADVLLARKEYRNIVLFLFDGMGIDVMEHHLKSDSFLRTHLLCSLSSVYPPTTTAATTSVESALTPAEHGWLGWTVYFPSVDANVNVFTNMLKDTTTKAAPYHVGMQDIPYTKIYERIDSADEESGVKAYSVSRFGTNKVRTAKGMFDEVFKLCSQGGKKYIYAYHERPDNIMHVAGTYGGLAKHSVQHINSSVQRFCRRLKQNPAARDTLVLVIADHGHIPVVNADLTSYPDLEEMFVRRPSLEPRAVNFFIKPESLKAFPAAFASHFKTIFPSSLFGSEKLPEAAGQSFETGDADFVLFSRAEILRMKLFGPGTGHPSLKDSVGDYLAASCSALTLTDSPKSHHFKSHHAGLTVQEMRIPLIAIT